MSTYSHTVAGAMPTIFGSENLVNKRFRIQFYVYSRSKDDEYAKVTFIPAVKCKDFYKDRIEKEQEAEAEGAEPGFFTTEFINSDLNWICPNTTYIELENDPTNYHQGSNFMMVVNSCAVAQAADKAAGIVSYADAVKE